MGLPFLGAEAPILLGIAEVELPDALGAAQDRRAHPDARGAQVDRRGGGTHATMTDSALDVATTADDARWTRPPRPAREQTRARYPDSDRLRRARRRPGLLGGLRRGRADDPARADLVRSSTRGLEAADPLPRPATGGSSRSTAAATAAPTGRRDPMRTRRRGVRRGRLAVMDATGVAAAVARRVCRRRGPRRSLPPSIPSACSGWSFIGPASPFGEPSSGRSASFEEHRTDDDGWRKYNVHYWRRDYEASSSSSSASACPSRTRRSRSRTAIGWGLETDAETLVATQSARHRRSTTRRSARCVRRSVPRIDWSDPGDPRRRRRTCARASDCAARDLGRPARSSSTGSGHLPHARDPVRVNLLLRDFIRRLEATP